MIADGVPFQDLPYRDMEKLRQVGSGLQAYEEPTLLEASLGQIAPGS